LKIIANGMWSDVAALRSTSGWIPSGPCVLLGSIEVRCLRTSFGVNVTQLIEELVLRAKAGKVSVTGSSTKTDANWRLRDSAMMVRSVVRSPSAVMIELIAQEIFCFELI